jgi:hypothetical protein
MIFVFISPFLPKTILVGKEYDSLYDESVQI